ncbi:MAG: hypothetical protein NXI16_16580 [Alphaproteobacteria bacterium]|nr:hypothetical protein [Alphaproteobacteria bacterium]
MFKTSHRRSPFRTLALLIALPLGACGTLSNPMELLPTVDRLVLTSSAAPSSKGTKISVDEMLARARTAAEGEDPSEAIPTVELKIPPKGLDGLAFQALGGFLNRVDPMRIKEVTVARAEQTGIEELQAVAQAIRVGKILEDAGYTVRLVEDKLLKPGSYRLSAIPTGEIASGRGTE